MKVEPCSIKEAFSLGNSGSMFRMVSFFADFLNVLLGFDFHFLLISWVCLVCTWLSFLSFFCSIAVLSFHSGMSYIESEGLLLLSLSWIFMKGFIFLML